jgi:hypothetical protein
MGNLRHFKTIFYLYRVMVSSNGGTNRSTQRKAPICPNELKNFVTKTGQVASNTHAWIELSMLAGIGTNCTGIYNSNEPTGLCFYSSILWRSKKYQFYSPWFDPIGAESTIYWIRGKHGNYYATDDVLQ